MLRHLFEPILFVLSIPVPVCHSSRRIGTFLSNSRLTKREEARVSINDKLTRGEKPMMRYSRIVGLVFLLGLSAAAQEPNKANQSLSRTIVMDVNVIDVSIEQMGDIEKIVRDKALFNRLMSDGKVRPIAAIQMRGRSSESTSARLGQRIPIQASATTQGTPQIQYENTGLNIDVTPKILDADRIEIKLHIELSAVVRNENVLAPTFIQRTMNDVVTVRPGETAVLLSVTQHEGLLPALPKTGSKTADTSAGNFVIVVIARLGD